MRFAAVFYAFATLSALVATSPVPVDVKPRDVAVTITSAPWALPTPGSKHPTAHCDPAFLRAADEEDPETGAPYRRDCARAL